MNKVILIGRLTKDPEIRQATETTVASYSLAVDRRTKSAEAQADFISCKAFGKSAEFAEKYLRKGTKICVTGSISTGSYTNKDGVKVYTTDVIVSEHEFVESKGNKGSDGSESNTQGSDGFMNIPDGVDDEGLPW